MTKIWMTIECFEKKVCKMSNLLCHIKSLKMKTE